MIASSEAATRSTFNRCTAVRHVEETALYQVTPGAVLESLTSVPPGLGRAKAFRQPET
jgi:hypothetical protein